MPKAGRQPQHTGEVHVQGARAAYGAPVRNVARRLAADDSYCDSGSQQRAAHSLIRLICRCCGPGIVVAAAGNS